MTLDSPASATEKVLGVGVNILFWRGVFDALGLPAVLGALVAAGSMTIAADPAASRKLRQVAGVLAAPGAMTIQVLRENELTMVEPEAPPEDAPEWRDI